MRLRSLLPLGLLALGACTPPRQAALGERCYFNDDCRSPLVCAAQRCRTACRTTRDCPAGQSCIAVPGTTLSVCGVAEEPPCDSDDQCPANYFCALDNRCRPRCAADVDCRRFGLDFRCVDHACRGPEDAATPQDAALDTQPDAPFDARPDAQPDAQPDVQPDVVDVQPDAQPDAQPDVQPDAQDAAQDAPEDAFDAQPDVQPDVVDAQPDVQPESLRPPLDAGLYSLPDGPAIDATTDLGYFPITTATALFAGSTSFFLALSGDTTMRVWGRNQANQLSLPGAEPPAAVFEPTPSQLTRVPDEMAFAWDTTCARFGGRVQCLGANSGALGSGSPTPNQTSTFGDVVNLTDAVQLVATAGGFCALRATGQVVCWGTNYSGSLLLPISSGMYYMPTATTGLSNVQRLAMAGFYGCAILNDGTARCWGSNTTSQLGSGRPGSMLTSSATPLTVVLPDGTTPLSNVLQLALGPTGSGPQSAACARVGGATPGVYCWGDNSRGQCGTNNTPSSYATAQRIPGLTDTLTLAGNGSVFCAVLAGASAGQVRCWGDMNNGLLGNGTVSANFSYTPVVARGLTDVAQLALTNYAACARTNAGELYCWGKNTNGEVASGSTNTNLTLVYPTRVYLTP